MKLSTRLVLMVALIALFSASVSGYVSLRAAEQHLQRLLRVEDGRFGAMLGRRRAMLLFSDLQRSALQATLIALGAGLIAGSLLAVRISQPVTALTRSARRYARGEREVAVAVEGSGELTELAQAFNDMAHDLMAKEQREKQLLTDIAHELRTPLTVLKSELESMEDGLLPTNHQRLGLLLEQVDLLARLVQDLRLLTLAEAGELELYRQRVDLAELITTTLGSLSSRATQQGVTLAPQLHPIWVTVDSDRIRQALLNLLDNALRYSPPGTEITIRLSEDGHAACLEVLDQGPGIPEAHLAHLFERFYRAERSRSREAGGSGLGLAIVRSIVTLHGGNVSAANRQQGGARFTVRLPLAQPATAALEPAHLTTPSRRSAPPLR